jgi:hypothetical protein
VQLVDLQCTFLKHNNDCCMRGREREREREYVCVFGERIYLKMTAEEGINQTQEKQYTQYYIT